MEDWDRRLANAYLFKYFNEGLMEGMEMFPGFMAPANSLNHRQVGVQLASKAVPLYMRHRACNTCLLLYSVQQTQVFAMVTN